MPSVPCPTAIHGRVASPLASIPTSLVDAGQGQGVRARRRRRGQGGVLGLVRAHRVLEGVPGGDPVGALHVELHVVDVHRRLRPPVEGLLVGHLVGERDAHAVLLVRADRQRLHRPAARPAPSSLSLASTKTFASRSFSRARSARPPSRSRPRCTSSGPAPRRAGTARPAGRRTGPPSAPPGRRCCCCRRRRCGVLAQVRGAGVPVRGERRPLPHMGPEQRVRRPPGRPGRTGSAAGRRPAGPGSSIG